MSSENVKKQFEALGIADRIITLNESSATVELAAAAIGCEGKRIAKTISFKIGDGAILVVASGDAKIDNAKFKNQFGVKAKMLTPDEAVALVGHAVGGICPFAVNDGIKTYLDVSLKRFDTVYPAAGSSNSVIKLTIYELEKYSCFSSWVDVCKDWQDDSKIVTLNV